LVIVQPDFWPTTRRSEVSCWTVSPRRR
jgi:hypothetical protein